MAVTRSAEILSSGPGGTSITAIASKNAIIPEL
jgi:hypothetical protein